jgi:hypothetical protein
MSFYVSLPSDTRNGPVGQSQNNYSTFFSPSKVALTDFTFSREFKANYGSICLKYKLNGTDYTTSQRIIEHQERETCNKLLTELNRIVSTELLPELYTDIDTQLLNIKSKMYAAKPSIPIKKAIYCIDATEVLTKNHPNSDEPDHEDSKFPSELWIIGTPSAVKEKDDNIVKISNILNATADDEQDNSHLEYSLVKTETEELSTIRYKATRRLIRDFIALMLVPTLN